MNFKIIMLSEINQFLKNVYTIHEATAGPALLSKPSLSLHPVPFVSILGNTH